MLTVRYCRRWFEPNLPHTVYVDGLYAGMMKGNELAIEIPHGSYELRVQFGGRVPIGKTGKSIDLSLSSTLQVEVPRKGNVVCEFHDRERLWNILFDIDLVVWIVSLFIQMPPLYRIISDVFFVVWLIRLVVIRKRYYKMRVGPDNANGGVSHVNRPDVFKTD